MDEIKDNENLSTNLPSCINDSKIVWGDLTDGTPDRGEENDPVFKNQREKLAFYIKKGRKLCIQEDGTISTTQNEHTRICISKGKFAVNC